MAEVDKLAAACACNRDAAIAAPCAKQNCSDIVNISIYFDGTGNNRDADKDLRRWANPARLWQSAQFLVFPEIPNYPIYVSGVGTQFNGSATDWKHKGEPS